MMIWATGAVNLEKRKTYYTNLLDGFTIKGSSISFLFASCIYCSLSPDHHSHTSASSLEYASL
jgi:hypothetical protein